MLQSEKFLPLKNMQAFTEHMFNNILAFQEKQHPAWDEKQSFHQRIQDLPLHYLVFSNGDRDVNKHSCTVAPYYPLRWEMNRIAWYILQAEKNAKVVDLHAGNGFIGSLLARQGLQIDGIVEPDLRTCQIEKFYDPECYSFWSGKFDSYAESIDAVFSAWMPSGRNYTPLILQKRPKVIIYVYTEHQHNGTPQTGCSEAYDLSGEDYTLIDKWVVHRPENLFHAIWPDLTPSPAEDRLVAIYYHNSIAKPETYTDEPLLPYFWETELQMAQLALEGKQLLQSQGYQLD